MQSYVRGAVVSLGVYALPRGARDLAPAAGGATAGADLAWASLAGTLADGGTIAVPCVGVSIPRTRGGTLHSASASQRDFRSAFALGAAITRRSVVYRTTRGPCAAISQLLPAPIAQTTYERSRLLGAA